MSQSASQPGSQSVSQYMSLHKYQYIVNYIRRANLVEPNHRLISIPPQLFTGNWMIEDDRRTFGSQTSDLWKGGATVVRAVREEKESEEKESAERRSRCAKRYKSSETICFFHGCVAPEGRKVGSPKRRGAEPFGRMKDQKLQAAVV